MTKMSSKNKLSTHEISLIKGLLKYKSNLDNQEIMGMINRNRGGPQHDINSGRISNIKTGKSGENIPAADEKIVTEFLNNFNRADHPFSEATLNRILPLHPSNPNRLNITESNLIECKEGFQLPLKTVAAFANNNGGYLVLGVKDKSWEIVGIKGNKISKFDSNQWNQSIRSSLGIEINFKTTSRLINQKTIFLVYIYPAHTKPVIFAKNGEGFSEGHIYYRYPGEDRLIAPQDLNKIIEDRISSLSKNILQKHLSNILEIGVENAAIMNLKTGEVNGKSDNFYIDEKLLPQISFIKEGEFVEKSGAPSLKLIGEMETTKVVRKESNTLNNYPFTHTDVFNKLRETFPMLSKKDLNRIINAKKIKQNKELSYYAFNSPHHEKRYNSTGRLPKSITSLYNQKVIDLITSIITEKDAI